MRAAAAQYNKMPPPASTHQQVNRLSPAALRLVVDLSTCVRRKLWAVKVRPPHTETRLLALSLMCVCARVIFTECYKSQGAQSFRRRPVCECMCPRLLSEAHRGFG